MFDFLFSTSAWLGGLLIFALRVTDMSLDTLRMLFVVRGRKDIAWALGFCQSVVFVIAITRVLSSLNNPLMILGYAAGFATGNVVGMWIEERLAVGHLHLRIVSSTRGDELAQALRAAGFGVTEISARGKDGSVDLLSVSVLRKDAAHAEEIVNRTDEHAFMTIDNIRPALRGFWRA